MPTADGQPPDAGDSHNAVEATGSLNSEIKRLSSGQAGLNWHADPLVTKQLVSATDDLEQHEQTTIFGDALETFQDGIKPIHTPPERDNQRLNDWFTIFAFDLDCDKLVTLQDMREEDGPPPETVASADLITDFTTPLVWAPWFGKQKRIFHYNSDFTTYDYHLPVGKSVFAKEELNPLRLTPTNFATFINGFLTRKYNLQSQDSISTQQRIDVYTSIFFYPLAEAVRIHENHEE